MTEVSTWLWGIFRHTIFVVVGAVVGEAINVWLKRNGIDLQGRILDLLDVAVAPENSWKVLVSILLLVGVTFSLGLYFITSVMRKLWRPPVVWVQRMRGVISDIQEECLSVAPDEDKADEALRRFRAIRAELPVKRRLGSLLQRIEQFTNEYLMRVSPGYHGGDGEAEEIHAFRESALAAIHNFMRQTRWAIGER